MTTAGIGDVVRELWETGDRHDRPPEPTPEADPWEDEDDPYRAGGVAAVVVFAGSPSIAVRLADDGRDVVTVEDVLNFDVPRRDTVAVVGEVLAGRVRLEGAGVGRLTRRSRIFGSASVAVHVAEDRVYRVQLPLFAWSPWVAALRIDP
jgi:hypothetical protein